MCTSSMFHNQRFRVLDPDLPFLASEVAIDIDNMLLGISSDQTAMRRLAEKLSQAIEVDHEGGPPRSRMDIATLTVLGEAVSETIGRESVKNITDLLTKANQISALLTNATPNSDRQELKQALSFCVALSRAIAAYRESIRDLNPPHPYRR